MSDKTTAIPDWQVTLAELMTLATQAVLAQAGRDRDGKREETGK